jgi:hypothetical protein
MTFFSQKRKKGTERPRPNSFTIKAFILTAQAFKSPLFLHIFTRNSYTLASLLNLIILIYLYLTSYILNITGQERAKRKGYTIML